MNEEGNDTTAAQKKLTMKALQEQIDELIEKHANLAAAHMALMREFTTYKQMHPLKKMFRKRNEI